MEPRKIKNFSDAEMKSKIVVIGFIALVVTISGCIENSGLSNDSNSNLEDNISNHNLKISNNSSYDANGLCYHVVDGDTIDVDTVGRIRLVGINTPEKKQPGYLEAKNFVKKACLGKEVYLDIDNAKHYDKYGRVLAVVYVNGVNINNALLKGGYANIMYIRPSEFNPYSWTT